MAKIIPIIGSPGSGCTTIATQLAMQCAANNETVTVIFADPVLPPKSYLIKEVQGESLGNLLSATELSEKQLLLGMDAVSSEIGTIGYVPGDKLYNFPAPSTAACEHLIQKSSMLSDTVILDIGSRLADKLSIVALEQADANVICLDGTLKSVAWQTSLHDISHATVVANALYGTQTAQADIFLPFAADLKQQIENFDCFKLYKEKHYLKSMQELYQRTNVKKKKLTLVR